MGGVSLPPATLDRPAIAKKIKSPVRWGRGAHSQLAAGASGVLGRYSPQNIPPSKSSSRPLNPQVGGY
jgi:hypothetical protein